MVHRRSAYVRCADSVYAADASQVGVHVTNQCYFSRSDCAGGGALRHWVPLHSAMSELSISTGLDAGKMWDGIYGATSECMRVLLRRLVSADKDISPRMHLLGLDVLLDASGRAWLLEANTNPVQAHDERAGDCGLIGDIARVAKAEGLDGLLELADCGWCDDDDSAVDRVSRPPWDRIELQ